MKKLLAILLTLATSAAFAQVTPVVPAGTVQGNFSGAAGPATPNAVPANAPILGTNADSAPVSVAVGSGLVITSGSLTQKEQVNTQVGTSYTIASTDCTKQVVFSNASAVAASLPQATGSFAACQFDVTVTGAGTATITPTVSTINGSASLAIAQNRQCTINSDGVNWQVIGCTALVSGGGGGSGTVNAGTAGQLAYYAGSGTAVSGLTVSAETLAYLQANTTFTVAGTGCTPSAHAGGPFGGTVTLASGPCTAIVITMNGGTGFTDAVGYNCTASDRTAMAVPTFIPAWGESATSTTTATLPIPPQAGTTDIISIHCHPASLP